MNRKSIYEALYHVQSYPGLWLGALDAESLGDTKMARLQAFLMALHFVDLDDGDPPFSSFFWWFSAAVDWIDNSHNVPFHYLEQRLPSDEAFDFFFEQLEKYKQTTIVELRRSTGPFSPSFRTISGEPKHPKTIIVGQFSPSPICFWGVADTQPVTIYGPFHSSIRRAIYAAKERWGAVFSKVPS